MERPLVVVEYLEEKPTRWLVAELVEAWNALSSVGARFLVTNAFDPRLQAMLAREGVPYTVESVSRLGCVEPRIILDLRAPRRLEPWEARAASCLVIGGIMGDYPPRGRGLLLKTLLPGASERNLGEGQMSIHSTAWVLARLLEGVSLDEIRFVTPGVIEVETPIGLSRIELPFYYPDPDGSGRGLIPERVRREIVRGSTWDEEESMWG